MGKSLIHKKYKCWVISLLGLLATLLPSIATAVMPRDAVSLAGQYNPAYFEENQGQFPSAVQYVSRSGKLLYQFDSQGLAITHIDDLAGFRLHFVNAEPLRYQGEKPQAAQVNYLKGSRDHWLTQVPTFAQLATNRVYPGIDLRFYYQGGQLEYDFVVGPGVNPAAIRLQFDTEVKVTLTEAGDLSLGFDDHVLVHKAPVVYQLDARGHRQAVTARYRLVDSAIAFEIANYDKARELIIDPVLEVSGLLGGEWHDQANAVATDSQGNVYIVGSTATRARITYRNILSLENTAIPPMQDLNNSQYYDAVPGISLDSSFIHNNEIDLENSLLLDANGDVLMEQYEYACDYRYEGFFKLDRLLSDYDGYISKYDADFNLIYTTYFGGCGNDGIRALAIDVNDNVYVAGLTLSDDFPLRTPVQTSLAQSRFSTEPVQSDGFYAKLDKSGALLYSSYLGGNGRDGIRDIAVDADENLYVTGFTHSTDLPTTCRLGEVPVIKCNSIGGVKTVTDVENGQEISTYADAFVARIESQGDVIGFLTYLGGKYDDWAQAISLFDNAIYIAGNTSSPDFTVNAEGYRYSGYHANDAKCSRTPVNENIEADIADLHFCEDVFLAKLSLQGTILEFSTYFGGALDDNVLDIALDSRGNIYLVGTSSSEAGVFNLDHPPTFENAQDEAAYNALLQNGFPVYKNLNQYVIDSSTQRSNAFFSVFEPDARRLILSSLMGGKAEDAGLAVTLNEHADNSGLVDVFIGGHTDSQDFYTRNSFNSRVSATDIFVSKVTLDLNKAEERYDPAEEPFLSSPQSCYPKTNNGCGLYEVAFSALLGGEATEDLKGMAWTGNALFLAGTTFSEKFPIVGNSLKRKIAPVDNIEYAPDTREIIDQVSVIPSDGYVMKLLDSGQGVDLSLSVSVAKTDDVSEGDKVEFQLFILNQHETLAAEDVRLLISFPYITSLEKLPEYVSTTLSDAGCVYDLRQLYCRLGAIAAGESRVVLANITARNAGSMPVGFSLSNTQADGDMTNNIVDMRLTVQAKSRSGSLSGLMLLGCCGVLCLLRFMWVGNMDLAIFKQFPLWSKI